MDTSDNTSKPALPLPPKKDSAISKEAWRIYEASGLKARLERTAADIVNKAFSPSPPRPPAKNPLESPYTILGVSPTDPPAMVDAVFRAKAKILHPDNGGDGKAFARLKMAYDLIRNNQKSAQR